jgi:hypothetical protein
MSARGFAQSVLPGMRQKAYAATSDTHAEDERSTLTQSICGGVRPRP